MSTDGAFSLGSATSSNSADCVTPDPPATGASRSTAPATTTTSKPPCQAGGAQAAPKKPSTPPAASTSATPPPGTPTPDELTETLTSGASASERSAVSRPGLVGD